jgi:hypothetical protein
MRRYDEVFTKRSWASFATRIEQPRMADVMSVTAGADHGTSSNRQTRAQRYLLDVLEERGGRIELVRLAISILLLTALIVIAHYAGGWT